MDNAPENKKKTVPEEPAEPKTGKPDDALESFLSRSTAPEKGGKAPKKKKLSRGAIALIIAIIVVAILSCVIVIVLNQPAVPAVSEEDDRTVAKPAEIAPTVDEKGEHQAQVETDAEGEIEQNGYGELLSYTPSQIVKIDVENTAGSFTVNASTPEGGATVYTLTGFEGYDLKEGMADAVANDAAALSFTTVASVGGKPADFGLDKPRATVTVAYDDNTRAVIRVGSEADGGAGTYVTFGDSDDIFLADNESVDSFLYNVLDLISYEITTKAESVEDDAFSVIELTGTHYPDPITLVPNTDEAFKNSYCLTSPYEMFADNFEGNDISGSIRDLFAESVVCVNPSDAQLQSFGVADPYAAVHAVYPDAEFNLCCSAPTDDGLVNLYNPDKGIIYTVRLDALGWANTDLDQLLPKIVIELNKTAVSAIDVKTSDASCSMTVKTKTETVTNDSGDEEEVLTTEAYLGGKPLPEVSFAVFFQNLNGMNNLGQVTDPGNTVIYEAKISYTTGRADDVLTLYDNGGRSCPAALNGVLIGSVSKSYATALQQDVADLNSGKTPDSL